MQFQDEYAEYSRIEAERMGAIVDDAIPLEHVQELAAEDFENWFFEQEKLNNGKD